MRTLILIFSFLFCGMVSAQSLYQPCKKTGDTINDQNFEITYNQNSYGLSFDYKNPCLTDELKEGIKRFVQQTDVQEFKKQGNHTVQIIQRRGIYYAVERTNPEKLFRL